MAIIKYFTLDTTTSDLAPLELPVAVDGQLVLHPSPAQAAQFAAYPRNDNAPPPTPPEGKIAVPDSWEVADGEWVRTWRYEDAPPPPPRTFSKLRIVAALIDAGVWAQAKSLIEQAGLYDLFLAAQDFAEDNEFFGRGKSALQTALGMTDEQVEAILVAAQEGA